MLPLPPKEQSPERLAGLRGENRNTPNTNATIARCIASKPSKGKRNPTPALLFLRGLLIDEFLYSHCPICGCLHTHEWSGNGYGDEEVVPTACKDQPYVKSYRIAPIKKKDLARLEESAREGGIYLPLTKLVGRSQERSQPCITI